MNAHLQEQMKDLGENTSAATLPSSVPSTPIEETIPVKRQGNKYVKLVARANAKTGNGKVAPIVKTIFRAQ